MLIVLAHSVRSADFSAILGKLSSSFFLRLEYHIRKMIDQRTHADFSQVC